MRRALLVALLCFFMARVAHAGSNFGASDNPADTAFTQNVENTLDAPLTLYSADGSDGSATAFVLDAKVSLTTAGDKLLLVKNNGATKFLVDKDGGVVPSGRVTLPAESTATGLVLPTVSGSPSSTATNGKVAWDGTAGLLYLANGTAWTPIAAGATIGGTIAATQVGFGSGTNTLTSTSDFVWNNTTKRLSIGAGASPGAEVDAEKTYNGPVLFHVRNLDDTGTTAQSGLSIEDDAGGIFGMRVLNTGFAPVGLYTASFGVIFSEAILDGILINTEGANDPIIFGVNDVEKMRLDGSSIQVNAGSGGYLGLMGQTAAQELRFYEPSGSGSNYFALKAQALASDVTLKWPADAGSNNYVLTTNGVDTLSWTAAGTGTIGGSIAATQVGFGSAANTLAGSANFVWINATKRLGIGDSVGGTPTANIHIEDTADASIRLKSLDTQVGASIVLARDDDASDKYLNIFMENTNWDGSTTNHALFETGWNGATGLGGMVFSVLNPSGDVRWHIDDTLKVKLTGSALELSLGTGGYLGLKGAATTAQALRFYEPTGDGTNFTAFRAVAQAGDYTYTLPPTNGNGVLTNTGGALTWETAGVTAHSALSGLTTGDDHTQYVLKNGRSTEQYVYGGVTSGGNLQLEASYHATDGWIYLRSPTQVPFNKFEVLNSDVGDSLFNKYTSSGSRTTITGGARIQGVIDDDVATLGGNVTGRVMGSYAAALVTGAFDGTASDVVGAYSDIGILSETATVTTARSGVFGIYDTCTTCVVTSAYGLQVYDAAIANNTRKRGILITEPTGGSASNIALLIGPDIGEAYPDNYAIRSESIEGSRFAGSVEVYSTAVSAGDNLATLSDLRAENATTGAAWNTGHTAYAYFQPSSAASATGDFVGVYAWAGIGSSAVSATVSGSAIGVSGDVGIDAGAANTIASAYASRFGVYEGPGGTVTNAVGVLVYNEVLTGNVTKYGILVEEATGASTANIDLGIGITTPFSATGSWAIYSESSRNSLLQGGLALGTTSQFAVNSSGNITKINNVTTSWPGSQGAANSVLQNNGSGTLTWVATPACANCLLQGGNAFGATLSFGTTDNEKITFKTNNTIKWELLTDGTLQPNTNNTYNLGGTTRRIAEEFFSDTGLHLGVSATAEMVLSYTDAAQDIVNFNTDSTGNADFAFFTDLLYLDKSASRVGILTNAPSAALSVGATNQFTVSSTGLITTASNAAINGGTISTTVTTDFYLLTTGTLGKLHIGDDSTEVNLGSGAAGTGCTMSPAGAYACASYGSFADLFTTETSFDLVTTNATSINFALAATTLTIGHDSSGGATFRNDVTVENNLQVNVALLPDADLGADVGSSTLAMRDTYTGSINLNSDTTADTGTVSRHVGMTFCDNTGGDASISLPAITTGIGQVVRIVKTQNTNKCTVNRTSTNTITVSGAGTGQTSFDIPTGTGNMSALCQANGVSGSSGIWVCDVL